MTPVFDVPGASGWEIGSAGFPVAVEITDVYVDPAMLLQGPVSPGFTPGPGAVYTGPGPALPQQAEERYLMPTPGLPAGARIGMVDPVAGLSVGGTGPLEILADVLTGALVVKEIWDIFAGDGNGGAPMANGVGLYGHGGMVQNGGMVPVGGPGVPEPPAGMVARQWKTKAFSHTAGEYWVHFFKLIDGRMMCYNAAKREWKMWRPKKPIVLYRGKVTLSQAVRAQRMLDKLWKTVAKKTKALKLA